MFEGAHRDKPYGRHGGDLKGISDHADYFQKLGVTTLWLNPVLENNQRSASYHGYAITDLYNVDRRFGTNEEYRLLIDRLHSLGLKMVQDMVMNHIGIEHWLVKDPPQKDWIHQFPTYTTSNYRGGVISDPYHSKADSIKMLNGWFDKAMPDVNQSNALFAQYLIQNSLWWIGYAGIDGIRMDTYPYPDKYFMAKWTKALTDEYPSFGLVGEVWLTSPPSVAYWQKGMLNKDGYQSGLPSVTDFPFCFAVPRALNEEAGWETGMARLYDLLTQDFIYPNASDNLTFLDNHDMTRYFRLVGKDMNKLKMGLTLLLTTRGIPQIYYGTEALMDGDAAQHSEIRKDFPGGWPEDQVDFFKRRSLSADQTQILNFMTGLLNWRKQNEAIRKGKLLHFIPENNVYVYFRIYKEETVMVIINRNDKDVELNTNRFQECLSGFSSAVEVVTNGTISDLANINLKPNSSYVLKLK
jgi:glycosidase